MTPRYALISAFTRYSIDSDDPGMREQAVKPVLCAVVGQFEMHSSDINGPS